MPVPAGASGAARHLLSSCGSLRRPSVADRRLAAASPEMYSGLRPSGLFRSAPGLLCTEAFDPHNRRCTMRSNQPASQQSPPADTKKSRGDSVNQVILIGRLVAAPELWDTASGKHVTTVRIATNGRKNAEFHDVVLWAQLAASPPPTSARDASSTSRAASRPPVAGRRRQHPAHCRDRRQQAPGAHQGRIGSSRGLAARVRSPRGLSPSPLGGRPCHIRERFPAQVVHDGTAHGPSRRSDPSVLAEDCVLSPWLPACPSCFAPISRKAPVQP
jgi:hypothetical protein